MTKTDHRELNHVVESAIAEVGVESAAIFLLRPGSTHLELAAAAGVEGSALERLVAAVRDPAHPIRRTVDQGPTFDVRPVNPGGPALRSHLQLLGQQRAGRSVVGVLALAHDRSLSAEVREALERLAHAAAGSIDQA
jgi:hypothetical protein